MRNRTRRAERGQNPPRRTRTEPAPATTPSSRPHASVQCSAQRTRLRASRAYLVRSPRKYTELRSRVGEVASSSPRGPLRGRAEREQNPTLHASRARVGSPRFRPPSHLRGVRRRVKSRSPRLRGERCCRTGHRYPTTRPHPGSRSPLPNQTARKELVASAKVGRGSVRNARQITDPGQTKPVRRGSALAPKEARGGRCSRFAQAKQSPGQQSTFPGGFARVPFHPHAKQSPRLRGGRHLRCGSPFTCCDKAVTEAGHKSWSQRGHSIKVVNTC